MAHIINLPIFSDDRGSLVVLEKQLPFKIKRIYYVFGVTAKRGGHRHKKSIQALICLGGSCEIYVNNGEEEQTILLNNESKCLVIEPKDWHTMDNFSENAILLVFASEFYDVGDYIDKPY
jgi:dTDP-4-dehydrorhamnose 3,5-epimerase-like enzyme